MTDKKTQGKRNRAAGQRFEARVRKYWEEKGWTVARWTNNVDFIDREMTEATKQAKKMMGSFGDISELKIGKLVPAKTNRFNMRTTGFPDFIVFKHNRDIFKLPEDTTMDDGTRFMEMVKAAPKNGPIIVSDNVEVFPEYEVMGVECKGGDEKHKYLDKMEKAKATWLIRNRKFSKILIANKGTKRGQIVHKEFE